MSDWSEMVVILSVPTYFIVAMIFSGSMCTSNKEAVSADALVTARSIASWFVCVVVLVLTFGSCAHFAAYIFFCSFTIFWWYVMSIFGLFRSHKVFNGEWECGDSINARCDMVISLAWSHCPNREINFNWTDEINQSSAVTWRLLHKTQILSFSHSVAGSPASIDNIWWMKFESDVLHKDNRIIIISIWRKIETEQNYYCAHDYLTNKFPLLLAHFAMWNLI